MAQMYYYNDVKLPALPEPDPTIIGASYTKDDIPYCVILDQSDSKPDYPYVACWGVGEWHHKIAERKNYCGGKGYAIYCPYDGNTWGEQKGLITSENVSFVATPIWANRDVTTWNGTEYVLYLPASDPVPVGGAEWKKHDAYKPDTKWNGHTFYKVIDNKWVRVNAVVPTAEVLPYYDNYLTFSSVEPFTIGIYNSTKNWDGTLYYSTDRATWSKWDGTTVIASTEHEAEQRIYMRGIGNSVITGTVEAKHRFVLDGNEIRCTGNIENLLDYRSVAVGIQPEMKAYCYSHLFGYCYNLIQAPELPSTLLTHSCYNGMFFNCTHLTTAPELPGTSLTGYCYSGMFRGCTSLLVAPKLQANILNEYCYRNMFYDCTSLTTIPELSVTNLKKGCYENMFNGCTNIKLSSTQMDEYQTKYQIPMGGGGIIAEGALNGMFENTGGTFTGTPEINAIYYTANEVAKNS